MRRVMCVLFLLLLLIPTAATLDALPADDDVIGTVETLLQATNDDGNTTREMPLCDTVADSMRTVCGADVAILNGGDVIHNLDSGPVSWGELKALFLEDRPLAVAEVTGDELKLILEVGVSHATMDMTSETLDVRRSSFDGFPQVSGITFRYDPTAPIGDRIVEIRLTDGTELSEDQTLTLAASEYMLSGGYDYPALPHENKSVTLAEALAAQFRDGTLAAPETGRITSIGQGNRFAISRPVILLVSLAAILIVLSVRGVFRRGAPKDRNPFF